MDIVNITPAMLAGKVRIPPSKSFAHRAVIAAFLSKGSCRLDNIQLSDDISATIGCIAAMGADCSFDEKKRALTVKGGGLAPKNKRLLLDCGESGSTLRFFIPIALALGFDCEFVGHGRLMKRPLDPYINIFNERNIKYRFTENSLITDGRLGCGKFVVNGGISSQFITGLLYALPILDGDSEIIIEGRLESRAYIDISIAVLKDFGIKIINENYEKFIIKGGQSYKCRNYSVEGDFSQAAFFLVAGALGCDISCTGLNRKSIQGDREIIDIIEKTGAVAEYGSHGEISAKCRNGLVGGITVDAGEIPDLVPILAVLLSFCRGESKIVNAGRLRIKESDRLKAISSELSHLGADITEGSDYLKICGRQTLNGTTVSAWNDHRIAMAAAIAACRCEGDVGITGAQKAVKKSYPEFFNDYSALGGIVK